MKFIAPKQNYSSKFLENLLTDRGVFDIQRFLFPTKDELLDYNGLDHIPEGIALLKKHLNDKIIIVVDCDGDGYTSAAVMWLYLKKWKSDIDLEYVLHTGKQHGLEDTWKEIADKDDVKLVILPDSSSNDEEYHQKLAEKGKDILVLDHHEAPAYSKYACVINNQLSEKYGNKALSGVGVVYKFCQALDEDLGFNYADDYLDLVAVGEIGDMMSGMTLENRYIFSQGLRKITNAGLLALIEKQSYSIGDTNHITPISIAFYISPLINALIRVGKQSEKEVLFKALISGHERVASTKRGAAATDTETLAEQNARNCVNARSRQNRAKEKGLDLLQMEICKQGLDENKIILVQVEENAIESTLTGLIAMQLVSIYKRPVLVLREDDEGYLRGSGRGESQSELKDFKKFLNDSGYFDFAEGHAQAFGCSIHKNKVHDFLEYANKELADINFNEGVYEADFYFNKDNKDKLCDAVLSIGEYPEIWGQGNPEPIFAVSKIDLTPSDISIIGKNSDTFKFTHNGVTFIKFNAKDLIEETMGRADFGLEIVGRAAINHWGGVDTPQILIEDYNFVNNLLAF